MTYKPNSTNLRRQQKQSTLIEICDISAMDFLCESVQKCVESNT